MTNSEAVKYFENLILYPVIKANAGVEIEDAINLSISALKKQIPQKPVEGYVFTEGFRELIAKKNPGMAESKGSCCPNCGRHVGESEKILKKKNYMPFCKWCGQALEQPE